MLERQAIIDSGSGRREALKSPESRRLAQAEAISPSRPNRLCAQFAEQRLGVFQIGQVETLGEPAVDVGEHRARLVGLALPLEQAGKADRRAQFEKSCLLAAGDFDRPAETVLRLRLVGRV